MNKIFVKPLFTDVRGEIFELMRLEEIKFRSVLIITSKRGAIRANHYHKKDTHYTYLVSGKFEYKEKYVNNNKTLNQSTIVLPGEMVKTAPLITHAMRFIEDSIMIVFTTEQRDPKHYEKDTVRVKII